MADEQSSHGMAFSGASDIDEPASKRTKMSPVTNYILKSTEADQFSRVSTATESWEAAANCPQLVEKEAKPVMAVEQAPAARGGDNNGLELLVSEPHKPAGKLSESAVFGATEDTAGMKQDGHLTALFPVAPLNKGQHPLFKLTGEQIESETVYKNTRIETIFFLVNNISTNFHLIDIKSKEVCQRLCQDITLTELNFDSSLASFSSCDSNIETL